MEKLFEYINKEVYYENEVIEELRKNYYSKSINALIKYIQNNKKNPNETTWNRYAKINRYLSSETIGYMSNMKFNILCKEIRKNLNVKRDKYI